MKTIYELILEVRENNVGVNYNIYKVDKMYGCSDFIEVFPNTKQFRTGNSRSTYSNPTGISIEVTTIKSMNKVRNDLVARDYSDIDRIELPC